MKFELDQIVTFEGKKTLTDDSSAKYKVVIWDYSARYNEYDIKFDDGKEIRGIREDELSELNDK